MSSQLRVLTGGSIAASDKAVVMRLESDEGKESFLLTPDDARNIALGILATIGIETVTDTVNVTQIKVPAEPGEELERNHVPSIGSDHGRVFALARASGAEEASAHAGTGRSTRGVPGADAPG